MTSPNVRPLQAGEESKLGLTMSRAFFDDPMTKFILPDADSRMKATDWMFTKMVSYCDRYGRVYTDEGQTGGSLWLSPGNTTMTTIRILRMGMWQMPFKLGFGGFGRFNKVDAASSKVHKKHAPGDHWYLLILGTDPDQQGNGNGSACIEIGAAQAQEAGLPVYLETMVEDNVAFYEKRGFEVVEEFVVEDELRIWSMIRNPT